MGNIEFIKTTRAKYNSLSKNNNALYHLTDTNELMLGSEGYISGSLNPLIETIIHISPTGNDDNDGSSGAPMKTFNGIMKKYGHASNLYIYAMDGTYNEDLIKFNISGNLEIRSKSGSSERVIINTKQIIINYGIFDIDRITISGDGSSAVFLLFKTNVTIGSCIINSNDKYGIDARDNSIVSCDSVQFNKCSYAVVASKNSTVFCDLLYSSPAGSENKRAFYANSGSTIIKNNIRISCTDSITELAHTGGIIR